MSAALVLAQQAVKLGVTVKVRQVDAGTYGGPLRNSFAISSGGTLGQPFLAAAIGNDGPYAQTNRSQFHDPRFDQLVRGALAEPALEPRTRLVHEAQHIQHERGGLLIWGFQHTLAAISPNVGGVKPEHSHFPTWRFDRIWLKA